MPLIIPHRGCMPISNLMKNMRSYFLSNLKKNSSRPTISFTFYIPNTLLFSFTTFTHLTQRLTLFAAIFHPNMFRQSSSILASLVLEPQSTLSCWMHKVFQEILALSLVRSPNSTTNPSTLFQCL